MKNLLVLALAAGLAGCAITQPKPITYNLTNEFDSLSAQQQLMPGGGSIRGTAFLRQQGGGIVTCAGQLVHLIPVTDYASERMQIIYPFTPKVGETSYKNFRDEMLVKRNFIPDEPDYREHTKTTKCDAQGEFLFENLKDGQYYIQTAVTWQVQYSIQGGLLVSKAEVLNGQSPRVIMSQ